MVYEISYSQLPLSQRFFPAATAVAATVVSRFDFDECLQDDTGFETPVGVAWQEQLPCWPGECSNAAELGFGLGFHPQQNDLESTALLRLR